MQHVARDKVVTRKMVRCARHAEKNAGRCRGSRHRRQKQDTACTSGAVPVGNEIQHGRKKECVRHAGNEHSAGADWTGL